MTRIKEGFEKIRWRYAQQDPCARAALAVQFEEPGRWRAPRTYVELAKGTFKLPALQGPKQSIDVCLAQRRGGLPCSAGRDPRPGIRGRRPHGDSRRSISIRGDAGQITRPLGGIKYCEGLTPAEPGGQRAGSSVEVTLESTRAAGQPHKFSRLDLYRPQYALVLQVATERRELHVVLRILTWNMNQWPVRFAASRCLGLSYERWIQISH